MLVAGQGHDGLALEIGGSADNPYFTHNGWTQADPGWTRKNGDLP